MQQNTSTLVSAQFGSNAQAYLTSSVHAQGADLQRLSTLIASGRYGKVLDLGCGAGHATFAAAAAGANVCAYDISQVMLDVVVQEAQRRELKHVHPQQGKVEKLLFDDASFDLVVTRFSAHHWSNVPAAVCEARRVLKPQGKLVVIDVIAAANPLYDTVLQTVEVLRDFSHVRDYSIKEWQEILQQAGFAPAAHDQWKLVMEFEVWIARMSTDPLRANAIRNVFAKAGKDVQDYFNLQADCSFDLDVAWLETTAP